MSESRVTSGYYDPEECVPYGLWQQATKRAIEGKRGQAALRDLLAALEAMPVKRLISGHLYAGGDVCALGALALSRATTDDEREDCILNLLGYADSDVDECAQFGRDELGLRYTLAWAIVEANDDDEGHLTPEERWQAMVKWLRVTIADEARHAG